MKNTRKIIKRTQTLVRLINFDVWGNKMAARKSNRWAFRMLHKLELSLRSRIVYNYKRLSTRFKYKYNWTFKKLYRAPIRPVTKVDKKVHRLLPKLGPLIKRLSPNQLAIKSHFFNQLLKHYEFHRSMIAGPKNKLISYWQKSTLFRLNFKLINQIGYHNFKYFYAQGKRMPSYIQNSSYRETIRRELFRLANYYCLYNKSRLRYFLRQAEGKTRCNCLYFGLEGVLLNLLFRTNLFPTTRHAYVFLKLGGVLVNGRNVKSPYFVLKLYDSFSISKLFLRSLIKKFRYRLRKRLIIVNVPNYLSYNYKIGHFYIWRYPTRVEKNFVYSFPFQSTPVSHFEIFTKRPELKYFTLNDLYDSPQWGFDNII